MTALNKNLENKILSRLIEAYQPEEIYIFGSYAWGNPDEHSDIDLLVIVNETSEKPYKRPIKGLRALRGLKISKNIVVYTKDEFNAQSKELSSLCHQIKEKGVKLYEAA
jgi:predicted nucleotidyltransferase